MAYHKRGPSTRLGVPKQRTMESTSTPAPYGGINSVGAVSSLPPEDCIYSYNLMPADFGVQLRKGWREWANGIGQEVRTIIPYEGQAEDGSEDALFAATATEIVDCTTFGDTSPAVLITFGTSNSFTGWGTKCQITNDASAHFMFYADEVNGLYLYTASSTTWAVAAGITGVAVADIAFVNIHKQRVWIIEAGAADAWYLPVDSIAGAATKFTFGSKFIHGGRLVGVWSWTIDGGNGVDDYLVALSSSGDVLVYKGEDPATDWALVGSYFIGKVPRSRNIAAEVGPDLYLLSVYGVSSVRSILQGASAQDLASSPTAKISLLLRQDLETFPDDMEWAMATYPGDNFLQITKPKAVNQPYVQYTQNMTNKAWGMWRDVPSNCSASWNGRYMMGTVDGQIIYYEGTRDGTLLDATIGEPISYSMLTSFSHLGDPASHKMVGMVRSVFIGGGGNECVTKVLYDYDVKGTPYAPALPDPNLGAVWDTAEWDLAVWDSPLEGQSLIVGAAGMGRVAAVAVRGWATARVYLVQHDWTYQTGGWL